MRDAVTILGAGESGDGSGTTVPRPRHALSRERCRHHIRASARRLCTPCGITTEEGGHDRALIEAASPGHQVTGHSSRRRPSAMGPRRRH